jgi:DNA-binding XRE family transcriptional regulator
MKSERLIYALCCPITDEVHYVGKSTSGLTRPMEHLSSSHSEKIKLWVSDLKDLNYSPKIKVLENISSFEDIDLKERYWIQYFLNQDCLLLNDNLITPLIINPNLDKILDGSIYGKDVDILKISRFIKEKRKSVKLTQEVFAEKIGVALTVVRKIEQCKTNVNFDGLLQILNMFGCTLEVVRKPK